MYTYIVLAVLHQNLQSTPLQQNPWDLKKKKIRNYYVHLVIYLN